MFNNGGSDNNMNRLSNAQLERLTKLNEECAEVQKCISKIILYGYDSYNPLDEKHEGNKIDLEKEICDVLAIISLMFAKKDIQLPDVISKKYDYLNHQEVKCVYTKPFEYILTDTEK